MPKQNVLPPLVLSVLLFCCFYFFSPWQQQLLLRPQLFYDGAWWQLISAQFMHHDQAHLWFNLAGVWMAWLLFPKQLEHPKQWWVILPLLLASGSGQLLGGHANEVYAGFSGTLYGLFVYAALQDALEPHAKRWIGAVVLLGIVIKLVVDLSIPEFAAGIAVFAHVGGIVVGSLLALAQYFRQNNA